MMFTQKKQFFKQNNFLHPFETTDHQTHSLDSPKRKLFTENFLYLPQKNNISKRILKRILKESIFCMKKDNFMLNRKYKQRKSSL